MARQARQGKSHQLPDGNLLKPGMTDPRVPILRKRLSELDLVVPEPAAGAAQSSTSSRWPRS